MSETDESRMQINIEDYILKEFTLANLRQPTLELIFFDEEEPNIKHDSEDSLHGQQKCKQLLFPFARSSLYETAVKDAKILVEKCEVQMVKQVMELTLNHNNEVDYDAGDTIAIVPSNPHFDVLELLILLGLNDKADRYCQLRLVSECQNSKAKLPSHIPENKTTPREIFRDCLNLRAVPTKQFLRALGNCCSEDTEANFLNCLSSKEGNNFYNELILEKCLKLSDLLLLCSSCKPTVELLIENLPRLFPRAYSISNSPKEHENEIKIIFSVLNKKPGIATSMLKKLGTQSSKYSNNKSAKTVLMYFRNKNKFRYTLEDALTSQQILIGIGTGVAPYIGFLEYKKQLYNKDEYGKELGKTWLFVGARTEKSVLYREKLKEYAAENILERYFESLSREEDAQYKYVQEQIKANADEFVTFLMEPTTILYVCADGAHISKSIKATIAECLIEKLVISKDEANELIKDFGKNGKYREDIWT